MMYILKQDERHMLTKVDMQSGLDDATPKIKFKLLLPAISSEDIILGSTTDGSNTQGFLRYLDLLEIGLEESTYTEVVEVFDLMHPWERIVGSANAFDKPGLYVRKKKKGQIQTYADVIHPPVFSVKGDVSQIELWTVDKLSGDLSKWIISEDRQGEKRIENEVVEPKLVITLD